MKKKDNNSIKIVGAENCENCKKFEKRIFDYLLKCNLSIDIEKMDCLSDKSIDLSCKYDINSIPFAIYQTRYLIFSNQMNESDIKMFIQG